MAGKTFFFYDLETSGISSRHARIMQFAGQRTDLELNPIGDPVNVLIKLTEDVLPEPEAVLITGITPQKTLAEGITETEFVDLFQQEVAIPGTVFVGFNNLRFDDEFIRFMHYRNYFDAYTWQWQNDRSRWDILDVVRMTRALRPDGIEWPFASDGRPTNRLEYLTSVNKLDHKDAHDALSDVNATIAVAKLILHKQPKLFNYLLELRDKKDVRSLIAKEQPLVYTSGRYPSDNLHTTVVYPVAFHAKQDSAIVYDLRFDPSPYLKMSAQELASIWRYTRDPEEQSLPAKTVKFNHCPALAPIEVIKDPEVQKRINLDLSQIKANLKLLKENKSEFADKLLAASADLDKKRQATQISLVDNIFTVDERLYDGFVGGQDKQQMQKIRQSDPQKIMDLAAYFADDRLKNLALLYKARNFPKMLNPEETEKWENFRRYKLFNEAENSQAANYFKKIDELMSAAKNQKQKYLLEELKLYGESILPTD